MLNAAAKRAGYSPRTADSSGPRLLGKVGIQAALQDAIQARAKRAELDADVVVEALRDFLEMADAPVAARIRAAELLGKHLGMFTERVSVTTTPPPPMRLIVIDQVEGRQCLLLVATAPNQVWTWDITRLSSPRKWVTYPLYVVLDLFSRYVVAWMVATRETATRAQRLVSGACQKQGIAPGQLTLHQDRGAPMTAKTFSQLLIDLDILASYSRPRVSGSFLLPRRRTDLFSNLLRLVQHPTPPQRPGLAHPRRRAPWPDR